MADGGWKKASSREEKGFEDAEACKRREGEMEEWQGDDNKGKSRKEGSMRERQMEWR